ncbi:kelch motif-containing protein [Streptomyces fragilis]|uniref:Kelch motif-containing protein n=1 Tax=Streptomyces fragilis TaxID=67301 RepID=A0ABV2YGN7_9ACTN|nr:kelch motif-containing protein [Streptomyces fragilis]
MTPRRTSPSRRKARRIALVIAVVLALAGANGPWLYRFGTEKYHAYAIDRPEYKAANGRWEIVEFPDGYRQNTIHAALLRTGKVLLVAGSGNDRRNFDTRRFDTRVWDPVKGTIAKVPTPSDLFCTGHTQLADGNLLVAGGTQRYERLKGDVTKAGGLMVVHNENPDKPITVKAGTRFTGKKNGRTFVAQDPVLVSRATKRFDPATGRFLGNDAGLGRVYVEAARSGTRYQTGAEDNYRIEGLEGADARNTYGIAQKLALDKRDFQGIRDAYEFDPVAERYVKVDPMNEARWYPTLTTLSDGKVLSVSGLDEVGQLVPGRNEVYDPRTRKWSYTAKERQFPTYPALFLMRNGKLFYSGSNAGYGPADVGRDPGIWDVETGRFTRIPGMSDPDRLETSGTVLLPPAQEEKYLVIGGGGIGESRRSSRRTRLVDLRAEKPRFTDGPSLGRGTRYPQSSILPDDTVLVSGGSQDYRGRSGSDILEARLYDPEQNSFRRVADPLVGRNYHSGSLLLPDGRVMFFGSDPLFADPANSRPGVFEQRIEIYTPPYLFRGGRPVVEDGPGALRRGGEATFRSPDAGRLATARLIRPSASTHVTDVDQRSIALGLKKPSGGAGEPGEVTVTVPGSRNLVQPGWYMLFFTDRDGVPATARWVKVS